MIVESNSSLNVFMACPRLYKYKYIERYEEPEYSQSRELGSMVHFALAIQHGKKFDYKLSDVLLERFPNNAADIERDRAIASAIAVNHHKFWTQNDTSLSDNQLEFIDTETEWEYSVGNNKFVGIRDGCVVHKNYPGHLYYEIKTTGERDINAYIHNLENSSQIDANMLAMTNEDKRPIGALYDIIRKPMIRQKKNETDVDFWDRYIGEYAMEPAKYFMRVIVLRTQPALDIADKELTSKFQMLKHTREHDMYVRNTGSCSKWGRLCSFFNACMDPRGDELLATMPRREEKLPEFRGKWKDVE